MGDRCSLYITVPDQSGVEAVAEIFGRWDDCYESPVGESCTKCWLDEINYGGIDEIQKLAEGDKPFYCEQGAGDDYGPYVYIYNGEGVLVGVPADHWFNPIFALAIKDGQYHVNFEDIVQMTVFAAEMKKATDTWLK